jgi:hypothetical protein
MTTYVTKTTRAPRAGRVIQCPHCGEMVEKYQWYAGKGFSPQPACPQS